MVIGWVGVAVAAEPLVYEGSEPAAVSRAAEATRVAPAELAPTAFAALRERPPTLAGGTLLACDGAPVTREQLLLAIQGVRGALASDDRERARAELGRVAAVERCPTWDPATLGEYWTLRGLLEEDGAAGFARARALAPDLAWDEAWPAERRAAFDAGAPQPPVTLTVPLTGYSVDGVPHAGALPLVPGWHAVEGPSFRGALVLDVDATLLVPADVPPDALGAVADEAGRAVPSAMFAEAFGDGARVFVVNDAGVWAATAGRTDWLALERRRAHPLARVGLGLTAGGAAVGAAGAVLAGLAYGAGTAAAKDAVASNDPNVVADELAGLDAGRGRYRAGVGIAAGGGAVTALGLALLGVGAASGPVTVGGAK